MNIKGLNTPLNTPNFGHCPGPVDPSPLGGGSGGRAGTHRGKSPIRGLAGGQRGAILLETVIASTVFAMVGVAVLAGLDMIYRHSARVEVQATAENVVRNQIEDVFSQAYAQPQTPYPTLVGVPAGYTVTVTATDMATPDPDIEKLNVTVAHDGVTILSIDTMRLNDPD